MVEQPASEPYVDAPILPGLDDVDHWSREAAMIRLARIKSDLPLVIPESALFCGGASNDVWDIGDVFLKVCWRADRERILRDAQLNQVLPSGVPHAPVHAYGRSKDVSWVLSGRVPGVAFDEIAENLPENLARDLISEMASILRTLHDWVPDLSIHALLLDRPGMNLADPLSIWASDLVNLPTSYAVELSDLAKAQPFVDPRLVDEAGERIVALASVDPFSNQSEDHVVIHSDPSFGNWFVEDGRITALLDFEWSRIGPRDLELLTPIFVSQPVIGDPTKMSRAPYLQWLEEDYPQLFQGPDLDRRLWLYELVFFLGSIIWWPPSHPEPSLQPDHHVHTLRRLLDGPLPRK